MTEADTALSTALRPVLGKQLMCCGWMLDKTLSSSRLMCVIVCTTEFVGEPG